MNMSPLDDHLHHLADRVTAPATPEARQAISRRSGVLRRRRQVRNAVGGGVLALALLAGGLALRGDDRPDVEMGPAEPGSGSLPALTVDLDGWAIVDVEDTAFGVHLGDDPVWEGSLQEFRRPGELTGPYVVLQHTVASDALMAEEGDQTVAIGDASGYLRQTGPSSITLRWGPQNSDAHAYLQAWGLSPDEVVEFAQGLEPNDDSIEHPQAPDEQFGFVATWLPDGIEEYPGEPVNADRPSVRRVFLERESGEPGIVRVDIRHGDEMAFEDSLDDLQVTDGTGERLSILDRPAVLVERPDNEWLLLWRHTDDAVVVVSLLGVDRSTVDDVADGIREMPEEEWQAVLGLHV
jgi:hypothetical protein